MMKRRKGDIIKSLEREERDGGNTSVNGEKSKSCQQNCVTGISESVTVFLSSTRACICIIVCVCEPQTIKVVASETQDKRKEIMTIQSGGL